MSVKPKKDQVMSSVYSVGEDSQEEVIITKSTVENDSFKMDKKSNILAIMQICIAISVFITLILDRYYTFKDDYLAINLELLVMSGAIVVIYYKSFKKMQTKHRIIFVSLIGSWLIFLLNFIYLLVDIPYNEYLSMFLGVLTLSLSAIYYICNKVKK